MLYVCHVLILYVLHCVILTLLAILLCIFSLRRQSTPETKVCGPHAVCVHSQCEVHHKMFELQGTLTAQQNGLS